jgi:hypothetical protein
VYDRIRCAVVKEIPISDQLIPSDRSKVRCGSSVTEGCGVRDYRAERLRRVREVARDVPPLRESPTR